MELLLIEGRVLNKIDRAVNDNVVMKEAYSYKRKDGSTVHVYVPEDELPAVQLEFLKRMGKKNLSMNIDSNLKAVIPKKSRKASWEPNKKQLQKMKKEFSFDFRRIRTR